MEGAFKNINQTLGMRLGIGVFKTARTSSCAAHLRTSTEGVPEPPGSFSKMQRDFPGGPGVKTPCPQCRGMGSVPGQGTKIPHAAKNLKELHVPRTLPKT